MNTKLVKRETFFSFFWIVLLFVVIIIPKANANIFFSLRPEAKLYKEPNYKIKNRIDHLDEQVIVKSPAITQSGDFCHYEIFNTKKQPKDPPTAWTPCFNILDLIDY